MSTPVGGGLGKASGGREMRDKAYSLALPYLENANRLVDGDKGGDLGKNVEKGAGWEVLAKDGMFGGVAWPRGSGPGGRSVGFGVTLVFGWRGPKRHGLTAVPTGWAVRV